MVLFVRHFTVSIVLLLFLWLPGRSISGKLKGKPYEHGLCKSDQFRCFNEKCIQKSYFCDGDQDCGDGSDETYCNLEPGSNRECPASTYFLVACVDGTRCIPPIWVNDGHQDCRDGSDEILVKNELDRIVNLGFARQKAVDWLLKQRQSGITTEKWGAEAHRIAVALYLADKTFFSPGNETGAELAYELNIQLLSRLALKKVEDLDTSEIGLYLNAFLVTCIDPRKFHVLDLVAEMRRRVDATNSSNPLAILALCKAGDTITERDTEKLYDLARKRQRVFWTDIQALAIIALSCAAEQQQKDLAYVKRLTHSLKGRQYRNGTVENLMTTALVIQALFATEEEDDAENFDLSRALRWLLQSQKEDGSFGSVINTYYVLPIINYKSLKSLNTDHCNRPNPDEESGLRDLHNQIGEKIYVKYSLILGDERDFSRNLELKVPSNSSFYKIMEIAASVDWRFRFKYNVKDDKPYVYSVSGIQDDPEMGTFWFPYLLTTNNEVWDAVNITSSPVDTIALDKQHFAFWYKSGSWIR